MQPRQPRCPHKLHLCPVPTCSDVLVGWHVLANVLLAYAGKLWTGGWGCLHHWCWLIGIARPRSTVLIYQHRSWCMLHGCADCHAVQESCTTRLEYASTVIDCNMHLPACCRLQVMLFTNVKFVHQQHPSISLMVLDPSPSLPASNVLSVTSWCLAQHLVKLAVGPLASASPGDVLVMLATLRQLQELKLQVGQHRCMAGVGSCIKKHRAWCVYAAALVAAPLEGLLS